MRIRATDIDAVIFDAVGTVIHPTISAPVVYTQVAADYGINTDSVDVLNRFRAAYHREEIIDAQNNWITSEEREIRRWQSIVSAAIPGSGQDCFDYLYQYFGRPDAWRVADGADDVFQYLQHYDLKLGLASNYDTRLLAVLSGHVSLQPLNTHVWISSILQVRKPAIHFFKVIKHALGCDANRILFVGDDVDNDYHGALAAGFQALLLDQKNIKPADIKRIATLQQLINIIY